MPEISWLRRSPRPRTGEIDPADPASVERQVYETLYGERSSEVEVTEVQPEPARRATSRRNAPKRATPSRAVG
jgi:hypothetical protein